MPDRDAVIVDAVRTPVGRAGGELATVHAVDLAAHVIAGIVERTGIDPATVDDVLLGCVDQVGEQSLNVARTAALAAGLPESVPAATVDRQCGSSQQAVHFAAQGILAGAYDVAVVGGVESMSRVPMFANTPDFAAAYGPRFRERYGLGPTDFINQGTSGEIVAERWDLSRDEMDAYAVESHHRAEAARAGGRFDDEILPITADGEDGPHEVARDQGIRPASSVEALAKLNPVFRDDGRLTAGNSSQLSDGAAALLVMDAARARDLGLRPIARVHTLTLAAVDPVTMLTAPIPATRRALERAGLAASDIDLYECNEAFACVPLAWHRELGIDLDRVNVNGGAIALGHPLGASGARIMTTLLHEMRRRGSRYGLQTMCEGGGMANATILELL